LYCILLLVSSYLHRALPRREALQVIDRESRSCSENVGIVEENENYDGMLVLRIRDSGTAYRVPNSRFWTRRRSCEQSVRYTVLWIVHKLIVNIQTGLHGVSWAIVGLNYLEPDRAVVVAAGWDVDVVEREPPHLGSCVPIGQRGVKRM